MTFEIGQKATVPMADGRMHPGIATSGPSFEEKTIINRVTKQPVVITIERQNFVQLRDRLDGEKYITVTPEVVQYGYKQGVMERFDDVIGLDVEADGTLRSLQTNLTAAVESRAKFLAEQYALRHNVTAAADL